MANFKTSEKGIKLLKDSEGLRLEAYLDAVGIPTIGYGNTAYEDGTKVKLGDKITLERAEDLLKNSLIPREKTVNSNVKTAINNNNFDALVSFVYNLGAAAFVGSTLLKKINVNPKDPSIEQEFKKWIHSSNGILPGLVTRRNKEWLLYSTPV